jgi:hypothetical protein
MAVLALVLTLPEATFRKVLRREKRNTTGHVLAYLTTVLVVVVRLMEDQLMKWFCQTPYIGPLPWS